MNFIQARIVVKITKNLNKFNVVVFIKQRTAVAFRARYA